MKYDICIVGHLTKDIIITPEKKFEKPGGVVYYSSLTAKRLGMNTCVVTKTSINDKILIKELEEEGIDIFWKESRETTIFENRYIGNMDKREQRIISIADKIVLEDINVNAAIYHFGPLIRWDIEPEVIVSIKEKNPESLVSLDIQGYLRENINGKIKLIPLTDTSFLKYVDILKTNDEEIMILSGKSDIYEAVKQIGKIVNEVIVTLGSKGSIIFYNGNLIRIPVFKPRKVVDPTGCGDIYTISYLFMRYNEFSPESSGLFASLIAGLNVEKEGINIPFREFII